MVHAPVRFSEKPPLRSDSEFRQLGSLVGGGQERVKHLSAQGKNKGPQMLWWSRASSFIFISTPLGISFLQTKVLPGRHPPGKGETVLWWSPSQSRPALPSQGESRDFWGTELVNSEPLLELNLNPGIISRHHDVSWQRGSCYSLLDWVAAYFR